MAVYYSPQLDTIRPLCHSLAIQPKPLTTPRTLYTSTRELASISLPWHIYLDTRSPRSQSDARRSSTTFDLLLSQPHTSQLIRPRIVKRYLYCLTPSSLRHPLRSWNLRRCPLLHLCLSQWQHHHLDRLMMASLRVLLLLRLSPCRTA
jgi:hypothetical protein